VLKTTVYLSEDEASGLRRLSAATGRSQSELIREGVRHIVSRPPKRTFHSLGVAEGPPYSPWDASQLLDRALGRDTQPSGARAHTRKPRKRASAAARRA
jgi:hypothetical protein